MELPVNAKRFAIAVIVAGAFALAMALRGWAGPDWTLALYVTLAVASSAIKIRLGGVAAYFTPNFLFLLAGVAYFTLPETVIACFAAGLGMSFLNCRKKPVPIQVAFNAANLVLSGCVAYLAAHGLFGGGISEYRPAWFAMVTTTYFVTNTFLVAGILSLTTTETFRSINARYYVTSFPYYLVGATAVGLLPLGGAAASIESWLLLPPLVYLVFFFNGLGTGKAAGSITAVERTRTAHNGSSVFAAIITGLGAMLFVLAVIHWESRDQARFAVFSAVGIAASFPRVSLPGIRGTISAGIVMVLAAVADLSLSEAILMAALVSIPSAFAKARNRRIHPFFAISAMMIASALAAVISRWPLAPLTQRSLAVELLVAALLLGCVHSALIATAMSMSEGRAAGAIAERFYFWGLPYYLAGAAAAGLIVVTWRSAGWAPALLLVPVLGLTAVSYQLHVRNASTELAKA